MSKGQHTREFIIEKAAELFNTKGFAGSSMADLMQATGLKKGGIYNHFTDKDEISLEAFKFAYSRLESRLFEVTGSATNEKGRLEAILDFYRLYATKPVVKGGCPLLNTLVDADNVNPKLITLARAKTQRMLKLLERIIQKGQREGEFKQSIDSRTVALTIFSGIEGALLMTRACADDQPIEPMISCLGFYLQDSLYM